MAAGALLAVVVDESETIMGEIRTWVVPTEREDSPSVMVGTEAESGLLIEIKGESTESEKRISSITMSMSAVAPSCSSKVKGSAMSSWGEGVSKGESVL